jgi:hypothetical protein
MVRGDSRRRSEAADAGHPQIHKHHVRSVAGYYIDCLLAVAGLGNHFDVLEVLKDGHQSSSENWVVIHDGPRGEGVRVNEPGLAGG